MPLFIPAEIDGRFEGHSMGRYGLHLIAIRTAAIVLTPRRLLCKAKQIWTCHMVVVACFGAA